MLCPAVISVFGKKKLSTKHFLVARDRQPGSAAPRHSFKICCSTFGLLSTSFTVLSLTTGRKVKHNYWKRSFRPEEYLRNMEGRESRQEGKKTNRKRRNKAKQVNVPSLDKCDYVCTWQMRPGSTARFHCRTAGNWALIAAGSTEHRANPTSFYICTRMKRKQGIY